ncbi:MAG: acyltransferase [Nitrosomonas sp.]|nr:acyltransferase [Nitrosomonas sp.]MBP7111400.1 acyltransferase [Nitrosomonas sp.]
MIARDANIGRVNELDLMRFLAALAVVFHHYSLNGFAANFQTIAPYPLLSSLFRYGYLGVDLFFMISGFVILMTASSGSLRHFVLSRLVRLYPAFWICCTITFVAILTIGSPDYIATFSQYLVNMSMLSGFMDVESIDSAYWSLFVELKFYALVAIVLLLGRVQQIESLFIFWLVATVALVIYPMFHLRFVLLDDYSANFIAGATFFFIWSRGMTWVRGLVIVAAWLCALYQSTVDVHEFEIRIRNDLSPFVIAAIVSAFFVIMGMVACKQTGVIGRANWLWLGAITYPLYLLHQGLGFMIYNVAYTKINAHILFWSLVIGMLLLAFLIHIAVERPVAKLMKNTLNKLADKLQNQIYRRKPADD